MRSLIAQFCILAMICLQPVAVAAASVQDLSYQWHKIYQKAPTTKLATAEKTRGTLADFAGKPVLINFWATWCTPCIAEMPTLDALAKDMPDLVVLLVATDNASFEEMQQFVFAKMKLKHVKLVHDDTGALLESMSKGGLPITYLMDAGGTLKAWYMGGTDWTLAKHKASIKEVLF